MAPLIKTYFTQRDDVLPIIHEYLSNAQTHVAVAVAWFTERSLFNKLVFLQQSGVQVELIITNHEFNTNSYNQYSLLEVHGGFFTELGGDHQLMHMKFCIIDHSTVISGSANWTKRAFCDNEEEVTVVTNNPDRANDFMNEFERLKLISGKVKSLEKELNIADAIQTLTAIEGLIPLNQPNIINTLAHKLRHINELEHIIDKILQGKYDQALINIKDFKKIHTQVLDVTGIKIFQLQTQIKIFNNQIEILEFEKVDLEAKIEKFNFRCTKELAPLISKILKIRKKIYAKLKKYDIRDNKYKDLEEKLEENELNYMKALEDPVFELSEDDTLKLSSLFRDLVKYCHPDSSDCLFEDKEESSKVFSLLTDAYKHSDIDKVLEIRDKLLTKQKIDTSQEYSKLTFLQAKLEALKRTHLRIIDSIKQIQNTKIYLLILEIDNWDVYFTNQKKNLKYNYEKEMQKYIKL